VRKPEGVPKFVDGLLNRAFEQELVVGRYTIVRRVQTADRYDAKRTGELSLT